MAAQQQTCFLLIMGSDIMLYRAAIGTFHHSCYCRILKKNTFFFQFNVFESLGDLEESIRLYLNGIYWTLIFSVIKVIINNNDYQLLILLLLLLSMDIHPNPGMMSDFTVFNWNARSVRNKLEYLEDIANEYDVLCITETHLDENITFCDLLIENYAQPFRKDRNCMGGGILVYCNENLYTKRRADLESPNVETIWIEIKLKGMILMICAVYRPPNSNDSFWENFSYAIEQAHETSNNIIIAGDINVNMLSVNRHPLKDILIKFSLTNTITEPTRVGQTCNTLLDPIILSDSLSFTYSSVIDVLRSMSDHNACVTYVTVPVRNNKSFQREVWIYKKGDFDTFNRLISEYDWSNLFNNCVTVDEACEKFTSTFLSMAKQCIPSKLISVRYNDKPWITSEVRKEIKIRNKLHKKLKENNTLTNKNNFKKTKKQSKQYEKIC